MKLIMNITRNAEIMKANAPPNGNEMLSSTPTELNPTIDNFCNPYVIMKEAIMNVKVCHNGADFQAPVSNKNPETVASINKGMNHCENPIKKIKITTIAIMPMIIHLTSDGTPKIVAAVVAIISPSVSFLLLTEQSQIV